jgi:hypothetical protein
MIAIGSRRLAPRSEDGLLLGLVKAWSGAISPNVRCSLDCLSAHNHKRYRRSFIPRPASADADLTSWVNRPSLNICHGLDFILPERALHCLIVRGQSSLSSRRWHLQRFNDVFHRTRWVGPTRMDWIEVQYEHQIWRELPKVPVPQASEPSASTGPLASPLGLN